MATLTPVALGWLGLGAAAVGTVASISQGQAARRDAERAANEQKKINAEQAAANTMQFERERRQQVREERIRRSQILNTAAQTGTEGSSGEAGAIGGMSSNLGANMGTNQASLVRGQTITGFAQKAADYQTQSQSHMGRSSMWGSVANLGTSMFGAAGGFNTVFKKPPTT